jgi:hypothetical protein
MKAQMPNTNTAILALAAAGALRYETSMDQALEIAEFVLVRDNLEKRVIHWGEQLELFGFRLTLLEES